MLRWMAPFLSFTAEEAWASFGSSPSIFMETFSDLGLSDTAASAKLLAKWERLREIRDAANKEIEAVRVQGKVGSSLQVNLRVSAAGKDHALLASLGDDLKFVFITSAVDLVPGDQLSVQVTASQAAKCERCWHYRDDVGHDAQHPTLCGRCTSNLYGAGEVRSVA